MEVIEIIRLTTCAIVLLNIIMVTDVDAVPHGRSRRGRTSVISRYSCRSMDQYACVTEPYGKKKARCIPIAMLCNGNCDCPLGDDERFCHFINPTVSTTKIETTTSTSTKTETVTSSPVVILSSTVSMVTSVLCTAPSLTTSMLPANTRVPIGVALCSKVRMGGNVLDEFIYVPTSLTSTAVVVKTLTCGPDQLYP